MYNYLKFFLICCCAFIPVYAGAIDCSKYKFDVDVKVNVNVKDVNYKSSNKDLYNKLGYTSHSMPYSVNVIIVPVNVDGGYCVSLRGVLVDITQKFNVVIDKKLKENSCVYNIVLKHENSHVDVYKRNLNDNIDNIKKTLKEVVQDISPIFVKDINDSNDVREDFFNRIAENEKIKKLKQDISDKMKQENDMIEKNGDNYDIWKCEDYYNEYIEKNIPENLIDDVDSEVIIKKLNDVDIKQEFDNIIKSEEFNKIVKSMLNSK